MARSHDLDKDKMYIPSIEIAEGPEKEIFMFIRYKYKPLAKKDTSISLQI
ncbi:hypothetical protein CCACVL1_05907 [Corchorus capsularis]|uniref:Uncharacterized protein n=1 Tax=Corchorus capsularis TaxID=210143 RepID=A0A1R3JIA4_COCAP|nr:hypothetical protein CCACVL1_05907 [Corchorus capsularis]